MLTLYLWQWKIPILPNEVQTSLVSPLHGVTSLSTTVKLTLNLWHSKLHWAVLINRMTSPQNYSYRKQIFVKLTLHFWHSKLHLPVLINRMTSPQNCSYRKLTTVMLTSHLWQITVKFNTTPLTVINLLPSSILNLWQSLFLRLSYWSWDERC